MLKLDPANGDLGLKFFALAVKLWVKVGKGGTGRGDRGETL